MRPRPRSRAFGPFTVVRRRRPTASGPRGVRVGRSAALRGPSEPAGVPQGTPGNQNSARQRRSQHHTRTAGPARFAHACPEPRGTCPHASATENSPLTSGEEPCSLSHIIAAGSRGLRDRLQRWYFLRLRRIDNEKASDSVGPVATRNAGAVVCRFYDLRGVTLEDPGGDRAQDRGGVGHRRAPGAEAIVPKIASKSRS